MVVSDKSDSKCDNVLVCYGKNANALLQLNKVKTRPLVAYWTIDPTDN